VKLVLVPVDRTIVVLFWVEVALVRLLMDHRELCVLHQIKPHVGSGVVCTVAQVIVALHQLVEEAEAEVEVVVAEVAATVLVFLSH
jgi:hypothetical protein